MTTPPAMTRTALLRRGFALEYTTLGWNVIGIVVLAIAALDARSVALAGFGLDSLIEIGASTPAATDRVREQRLTAIRPSSLARQARQRSISSGGLARRSSQKSAPNSRTPASDTSIGTQATSLNPAARRHRS